MQPTERTTTVDQVDDPWLYASQAAELVGVKRKTWSTGSRPAQPGAIPRPGRRHPENGRPQWLRSAVLAYRHERDERTGRAQAIHERLKSATARIRVDRGEGGAAVTADDLAAALGVNPYTVRYHLAGRCSCRA
jgi:hypothetical protein